MANNKVQNVSVNRVLEETSFLYGTNAPFIEQLYVRYVADPASVGEEWRTFFAGLGDDKKQVEYEAHGPSWARSDWPTSVNGDGAGLVEADRPRDVEVQTKLEAHAPDATSSGSSDAVVVERTLHAIETLDATHAAFQEM